MREEELSKPCFQVWMPSVVKKKETYKAYINQVWGRSKLIGSYENWSEARSAALIALLEPEK